MSSINPSFASQGASLTHMQRGGRATRWPDLAPSVKHFCASSPLISLLDGSVNFSSHYSFFILRCWISVWTLPPSQQQHRVKPDISTVPPLIALWLPSNAETLVCHALSALPLPFISPVWANLTTLQIVVYTESRRWRGIWPAPKMFSQFVSRKCTMNPVIPDQPRVSINAY